MKCGISNTIIQKHLGFKLSVFFKNTTFLFFINFNSKSININMYTAETN